MLRAYYNMPSAEFIAQLRTYVIAMGLGTQVVDAVDNLTGIDEIEGQHAEDLEEVEVESEKRGRQSMKNEIIDEMVNWLGNQPKYNLIAAPCKTLIKEIEKIEV